ncbi:MAG: hypothetical protein HFI18_00415 [Lachnospiraceae bacterium]|nr:hypothetical protein [Lachnospiraceae bacterium]
MKSRGYLSGLAGILLAGFLLCSGITVLAAPSVEGDTELTVTADEMVAAEYTITNDEAMESVTLTLSYDRELLTYVSGSGGDNFSGNGGNGSVQLSSRPDSKEVSFSVRFQGNEDGNAAVAVTACTIVVDGTEIDVLSGEPVSSEETEEESGEEEDGTRASFVIDERTFYVRRPDNIEGFEAVHLDIQGIDSRVLKHNTLDLYVVRLRSDNGSYRDDFVYNPDTGNVIPFVQMESGNDDVIFIEPEEGVHVPTRYTSVNLGWGPKYEIPALKHVIIDGVDEIQDDTNRYLIYGINQDGEKAWYSYDYDKNSLQLFDDVAYQGEQNYILELEEKEIGLRAEASEQAQRYDRIMARRLYTILILIILVVVLLNVLILMYLRMRKMEMPKEEEMEESGDQSGSSSYVTGNLEENESDFQEPVHWEEDEDEEDDLDLEIIDLDDLDDEN